MTTLHRWESHSLTRRASEALRRVIHIGYITSVALIVAALWKWGAVEMRGQSGEVFFLTFLGIIWLIVSLHLFPWFGLLHRRRRRPDR